MYYILPVEIGLTLDRERFVECVEVNTDRFYLVFLVDWLRKNTGQEDKAWRLHAGAAGTCSVQVWFARPAHALVFSIAWAEHVRKKENTEEPGDVSVPANHR